MGIYLLYYVSPFLFSLTPFFIKKEKTTFIDFKVIILDLGKSDLYQDWTSVFRTRLYSPLIITELPFTRNLQNNKKISELYQKFTNK